MLNETARIETHSHPMVTRTINASATSRNTGRRSQHRCQMGNGSAPNSTNGPKAYILPVVQTKRINEANRISQNPTRHELNARRASESNGRNNYHSCQMGVGAKKTSRHRCKSLALHTFQVSQKITPIFSLDRNITNGNMPIILPMVISQQKEKTMCMSISNADSAYFIGATSESIRDCAPSKPIQVRSHCRRARQVNHKDFSVRLKLRLPRGMWNQTEVEQEVLAEISRLFKCAEIA